MKPRHIKDILTTHTFSAIIWRKTSKTLSPTQIMHCIMPVKKKHKAKLVIFQKTSKQPVYKRQVSTWFVLLNGFVLKISKHDLKPVGIIGSQHPGGGNSRRIKEFFSKVRSNNNKGTNHLFSITKIHKHFTLGLCSVIVWNLKWITQLKFCIILQTGVQL